MSLSLVDVCSVLTRSRSRNPAQPLNLRASFETFAEASPSQRLSLTPSILQRFLWQRGIVTQPPVESPPHRHEQGMAPSRAAGDEAPSFQSVIDAPLPQARGRSRRASASSSSSSSSSRNGPPRQADDDDAGDESTRRRAYVLCRASRSPSPSHAHHVDLLAARVIASERALRRAPNHTGTSFGTLPPSVPGARTPIGSILPALISTSFKGRFDKSPWARRDPNDEDRIGRSRRTDAMEKEDDDDDDDKDSLHEGEIPRDMDEWHEWRVACVRRHRKRRKERQRVKEAKATAAAAVTQAEQRDAGEAAPQAAEEAEEATSKADRRGKKKERRREPASEVALPNGAHEPTSAPAAEASPRPHQSKKQRNVAAALVSPAPAPDRHAQSLNNLFVATKKPNKTYGTSKKRSMPESAPGVLPSNE